MEEEEEEEEDEHKLVVDLETGEYKEGEEGEWVDKREPYSDLGFIDFCQDLFDELEIDSHARRRWHVGVWGNLRSFFRPDVDECEQWCVSPMVTFPLP
jgi:hypothetical protein